MLPIKKYPRTQHIEGSRLQPGDEDLAAVPFKALKDSHLVVEEKIDGANCALSFDSDGSLLLQSRGHYLIGGVREKHFNLFKQWTEVHQQAFLDVLLDRYVVYGEWVYAKHTVFYDALPHYFMEFDVFDRETETYLDTPNRQRLLAGLPIVSVPVLHEGRVASLEALKSLIGPSNYISPDHLERLMDYCREHDLDAQTALNETDSSITMEGLYVKAEEDGIVQGRYKFVRAAFLQTALSSGSHWLARPIIPNGLTYELDRIFLPELPETPWKKK